MKTNYNVITIEYEYPRPIDAISRFLLATHVISEKSARTFESSITGKICGRFAVVEGPELLVDWLSRASNFKSSENTHKTVVGVDMDTKKIVSVKDCE